MTKREERLNAVMEFNKSVDKLREILEDAIRENNGTCKLEKYSWIACYGFTETIRPLSISFDNGNEDESIILTYKDRNLVDGKMELPSYLYATIVELLPTTEAEAETEFDACKWIDDTLKTELYWNKTDNPSEELEELANVFNKANDRLKELRIKKYISAYYDDDTDVVIVLNGAIYSNYIEANCKDIKQEVEALLGSLVLNNK